MGEKSKSRGPSGMPTLRWTFKILAVLGYFPISYWPTLWQKILYNFYGIFLTICLYILETTQLLDLMFGVESQDEFSENLYITLVFFCDSCKTVALLRRCENIVDLIETVKKEPFAAMNAEEEKIQAKFMEQVEWNSIIYTLILDLFVLGMWIVSFLTDFPHGRLKYRAWIPYDYSSPWIFAITYVHQVVATTFATNLIIACDSMFSGLLVNIYCQIEVLEYRLKNVGKYPYYSVKLCARHHQRIYEFATAINEEFTAIISVQFMVNTISLCFNHYRLSQLEFGSKFIETAAYTFCLLTQIFYYCWYGNEVKLKSLMIADAAFESTLMSLDNNTRKMFLMIMIRAMEPIQFTSIHIVSMNLESFITLLKTSYSAYTVLQQTN